MSDQMSDLGRLHIINRFWLFTIIPCQTRCKIWSCFILSTGSDYLELSYVRPDVRFEHASYYLQVLIIYNYHMSDQMWNLCMLHSINSFWLFTIILYQTRCQIWAGFILSTGSDYLELSYVRLDVRSGQASYYQQVLIIYLELSYVRPDVISGQASYYQQVLII